MKEILKPIPVCGYDNYRVSNLGYVKNVVTGKILKPQNNGKGYLHVSLYNNDHISRTVMIHRLVALAFLENPLDLPQVNHIDENKHNNRVDNLEWVTSVDNINHGTHNIRVGMNNPRRRPIYSVTKDGDVKLFESGRDASRYYKNLGIYVAPAGITKALKSKIETYKNLAWYYQSDKSGYYDYLKKFDRSNRGKPCKIHTIAHDGKITYFDTIVSAIKFYDLGHNDFQNIKSAIVDNSEFCGMKWFYT